MKKFAMLAPVAVALLGMTAPALAQSASQKAQIESRFKKADVNKDGKLSFDEWSAYAREDEAVMRCYRALGARDDLDLIARVRAS